MSLVSNESSSGDRFQVTVAMPGGFANDVRSLSAFWISLSVSGVPCSLDGRSVLRIDFLPPTNPLVFGPSASWQVKAPIWDLVPSGSCDPRCQNASALYVIEGAAFCEDDAVVSGIGAPGWSLNPSVQAGDVVKVAVVPGGASGLLVYLNDSTHPTSSTRWQYGSSQLVTGVAAEPFGPFANATTGWSFGGDLSVGYTNCPVGNGSAGAPPCTSYDAVSSSADAFPTLENATFYNASAFAYREAYPSAEVWSSSGGCSGQPNATGCADFTSQGGSGVYPPLSLDAHQGAVRIAYGTNASDRVGLLGGGPSEFAPDGSAVPGSPGTITHLAASYNNTTLTVSARATDPRGVGSVEFGGVWCFSGTNPPSANAFTGTKGIGPWNGSEDANWSITLPRGTNTTSGTFYYWAREFGPAAAPSGPPTFGRLAISGSTPCGAPVEGPASVAGATARSDGYRVNWILGAALGPAVHNFSLIALGGGSAPNVVVPVADPTARSA
ncbi:MAG TPA: hypothetical protein VGS18_02880, partial [Thermoplasmata archaeon]|nr:hypothetical protein [Thermoplasmata archaeon]